MSDTEPLTAGYELNLLVAKKLGAPLELTHQRWLDILDKPGNTVCNYGRGIYMRCDGCGLNGYGNEVDWETPCPTPICKDYSTDMEAAWEIVEKAGFSVIRSDDDEWMVGVLEITGIGDKYGNMEDVDVRFPKGWRAATTPAHAIVLAFLALTDLEVKE